MASVMYYDRHWAIVQSVLLLSSFASNFNALAQSGSNSIDLSWHAPNTTQINDLTTVINGTGVYGFIFNSSTDAAGTPYGTYNWCNMPHVRPREYPKVDSSYKLEYVEVIHRHHKRTPYAANTFPVESYSWSCSDEGLFYYGQPIPADNLTAVSSYWSVFDSNSNPFVVQGFNGTCQFPQITAGGLSDSYQHGADLKSVYGDMLGFIPSNYDNNTVSYRVTNNVITSQVAGEVVAAMHPGQTGSRIVTPLLIQPDSIDSLEPAYSCPRASSITGAYGPGSTSPGWLAHLNASAPLFSALDALSGVNPTASDWHVSWDHYFDNLSSRLCHDKPLPCNISNPSLCVTQHQANEVFRLGEYEYSYIYRDDPMSLPASTASYGVYVAELATNLRGAMGEGSGSYGGSGLKYRHNIAHDGSISPLLSILQIDVMVWPGMGAEVVFELYRKGNDHYLRVLWGGQVLRSNNPSLGYMNMVPAQTFLSYIDGLVGQGARKVPALCNRTISSSTD
ncbi:MAG: hypothetical protein M1822_003587 [Bathelium mastoideum]|nr:MAG: hypothetical protein M1822_003587 [Bathelium mastoideum]